MNQYYRIFLMPSMSSLHAHDANEVGKAVWVPESDLTPEFLAQCNSTVRLFFRQGGLEQQRTIRKKR
jgi:hypothetical protein